MLLNSSRVKGSNMLPKGQPDEVVDHAAEEQQEEGDVLAAGEQKEELTMLLKSSR